MGARGRLGRARSALAVLLAALIAPLSVAADPLDGDAAEQEVLRSVRAEKFIRAREQAEKILRARPDSIIARYSLALVFHDEETNLPRALHHIRLATAQLTSRYGQVPVDARAQAWHRRFLEEEEEILGEMDHRAQQLAVMDRHDALYRPTLDRRRIWPLMKLHRFDEALRLARRVALSEEMGLRTAGLNGMIAIESERLRPKDCFAVGLRGVESTGGQSCILLENTAEAAFSVYRFDEAERLALKSLQARIKDCPSSAHPHLANLYLLRADFQRAMQAVKAARTAGAPRRYRQQFEMGNAAWLGRLLYTLGQFAKARDLAEQVVRAPDRVGMTSFSSELMRVISLVDYHAAIEAQLEEQREQASARPLGARIRGWFAERRLEQAAWAARFRAVRSLGSGDTLVHLLRPYFKPIPPWNAGALITIAGGGVLLRALREARARETMPKETAPYFDALEGEIAYRDGDLARALPIGRRAFGALPRDEVLLRSRVAAWAADAALRLGQAREAESLFHEVLHRFPTALRVLGVRLPARVVADGRPLSRQVARTLLRSPRLSTTGDLGFVVSITGEGKEGKALKLCLLGRGGRRYACASKDVSAATTDDERVAWAIDELHAKVFAPKIDLTQQDINSLDGSAVRGDADEVLKQVLGK